VSATIGLRSAQIDEQQAWIAEPLREALGGDNDR